MVDTVNCVLEQTPSNQDSGQEHPDVSALMHPAFFMANTGDQNYFGKLSGLNHAENAIHE